MKKEQIEIAIAMFEAYPAYNTLHITQDEQVFFDQNLADAHALALDKKNPITTTVTREDLAVLDSIDAETNDPEDENDGTNDPGVKKPKDNKTVPPKAAPHKAAPPKA